MLMVGSVGGSEARRPLEHGGAVRIARKMVESTTVPRLGFEGFMGLVVGGACSGEGQGERQRGRLVVGGVPFCLLGGGQCTPDAERVMGPVAGGLRSLGIFIYLFLAGANSRRLGGSVLVSVELDQ